MFGMKIESVREEESEIEVRTTGASYLFHRSSPKGRIQCFQRLGRERLIATLELPIPLGRLTVEGQTDEVCVLHQASDNARFTEMRINADSLLVIGSFNQLEKGIRVGFETTFSPEYQALEKGCFLAADQFGGIGIYPEINAGKTSLMNSAATELRVDFPGVGYQRLLLSVFPPRPFNWERSFSDRIVHHIAEIEPYPRDEQLEDWSRWCNVLVLHAQIWQGKYTREGKRLVRREDLYQNASWAKFHHVPLEEEELRRVVARAHQMGMRVIAYLAPFYSLAEGEEFLEEMRLAISNYQLDGIYFDGNSFDPLRSYQTIRATRRLLGDKILYVHCTDDPISSPRLVCPFIDTYADYTLRAEHIADFDPKYLRYIISGYNISNAIGFVCNYNYPPEVSRRLVDQALAVGARLPLFTGRQLDPTWESYFEETGRIMKQEYFPKLDREKKHWEAGSLEISSSKKDG